MAVSDRVLWVLAFTTMTVGAVLAAAGGAWPLAVAIMVVNVTQAARYWWVWR